MRLCVKADGVGIVHEFNQMGEAGHEPRPDRIVRRGGETLRQAVQGLTREDLIARPGPVDWSIQELVIHLADSDAIAIDRMKRILTEDNPPSCTRMSRPTSIGSCPTSSRSRTPSRSSTSAGGSGRACSADYPTTRRAAGYTQPGRNRHPGRNGRRLYRHLENHLVFLKAKRERLGKPLGEGD